MGCRAECHSEKDLAKTRHLPIVTSHYYGYAQPRYVLNGVNLGGMFEPIGDEFIAFSLEWRVMKRCKIGGVCNSATG